MGFNDWEGGSILAPPPLTPGKAIFTGDGAMTENISQFVDQFVNPFSPNIKCFVTAHFLEKIEEEGLLPACSMLVPMDVLVLYPNIPQQGALDAIRTMYNKQRPVPVVIL
jgi:hypothetical protein